MLAENTPAYFILARAKARVERAWCQGMYCQQGNGFPSKTINSRNAWAFDLAGAVMTASWETCPELEESIRELLSDIVGIPDSDRLVGLEKWNDSSERTVTDVVNVLKVALEWVESLDLDFATNADIVKFRIGTTEAA